METGKEKLKKTRIFHIILLSICLVCIVFIFYWRQKTTLYYFCDEEVYIDEIAGDKIVVKGLPYTTGKFIGEYIIQIDNNLIIQNGEGGAVSIDSLDRGDILLFDYSGPKDLKLVDGDVLNGKKINAYNFRLSKEKLNLKFWGVE